MLLKEPNYKRKAQRVDLPLLVQIDGKTYKTKDWSLAGVGILDLEIDFEPQKKVDCRLVLPLDQANFTLPATIVLINCRGSITGCEFFDLSPKNKRVLRRFIELAIEGRIDNVEDFIAAYSEPVFETPVSEALTLEEKEALSIKKTFIKKSLGFLFVGAVVAFVIGYTAIYNLQYKIFSTGVVTGSFVKVTANAGGIIDAIHVNIHDNVDKGLVLFDLIVTETVRRPMAQPSDSPESDKGQKSVFFPYTSDVISSLEERVDHKRREYEDASSLYAQHLITRKDFNIINGNFIRAKIELAREKERVRREDDRRREQLEILNHKRTTKQTPSFETVSVSSIKRRISPSRGMVYHIEHREGEYVHPDETVMVIQTENKPFVVLKLHSRDIYKVKVNDEARIYTNYNDKYYRGRVSQIGYAAVNANATISQETSLNESLVKIEFIDTHVDFPLNSRVKVRIRRDYLQG